MTLDSAADYCYITTTGRMTGRLHQIEIWFGLAGRTLYVLAGGGYGADFVRNLIKDSRVTVRIATRASAEMQARARVVEGDEEDVLARRLLLEKYAPGYDGSLDEWGRTALVVAFDLDIDSP